MFLSQKLLCILALYLFRAAPQSYLRGCLLDLSPQFSSVAQSYLTLCDPMDCSTPGLPVHHQLSELLKLMSFESVMPSNHIILCHPLHLLPSIFPSSGCFPRSQLFASGGLSMWILRKSEQNKILNFCCVLFLFLFSSIQQHSVIKYMEDVMGLTSPKFWFFTKFTCQSLNVTEFKFDLLTTWQASNLEPKYWGKE